MGLQKILPKTETTLLKNRKRIKKCIKLLIKPKNKRNKLIEEQFEEKSKMEDNYNTFQKAAAVNMWQNRVALIRRPQRIK